MSKTDQNDPPPPYSPTAVESQPKTHQYAGPNQYQNVPHSAPGVAQPPGYQPYSGSPQYPPGVSGNYSTYGSIHTVTVPQTIIIVNACPACRIGVLEDQYSALGIICAVLFFPIGILCCLATKTRRCSNCGAYFD